MSFKSRKYVDVRGKEMDQKELTYVKVVGYIYKEILKRNM